MKIFLCLMILTLTVSANSKPNPRIAYEQASKGKAVIIDVRESDEIKSGMINKAKWFPLSKIEQDKEWKKDFLKLTKNKKIYLHCRSGKRSEKVKKILNSQGIASENLGGYEELKNILPLSGKNK